MNTNVVYWNRTETRFRSATKIETKKKKRWIQTELCLTINTKINRTHMAYT